MCVLDLSGQLPSDFFDPGLVWDLLGPYLSQTGLSFERFMDLGREKPGDPRGIAFATTRLAAGATAVRDMIVEAWQQSADTPVGYPMVNLRDIENGKVKVTRDLFGAD